MVTLEGRVAEIETRLSRFGQSSYGHHRLHDNVDHTAVYLTTIAGIAAGGDLSGTYVNPNVAAIHETSGPTKLTIGTITDGQFLKRVGGTLVSAAITVTNTLLDGANHTDTLAGSVATGDVIVGNATPLWARLARSVPAANVRNVLGLDNGDTIPAWKTALDSTVPATQAFGDAASAGTSLVFSHRDHKHGMMAAPSTERALLIPKAGTIPAGPSADCSDYFVPVPFACTFVRAKATSQTAITGGSPKQLTCRKSTDDGATWNGMSTATTISIASGSRTGSTTPAGTTSLAAGDLLGFSVTDSLGALGNNVVVEFIVTVP